MLPLRKETTIVVWAKTSSCQVKFLFLNPKGTISPTLSPLSRCPCSVGLSLSVFFGMFQLLPWCLFLPLLAAADAGGSRAKLPAQTDDSGSLHPQSRDLPHGWNTHTHTHTHTYLISVFILRPSMVDLWLVLRLRAMQTHPHCSTHKHNA